MKPLLRDIPRQIETERLILRCPMAGDGQQAFEGVRDSLEELRAWPASLPWAVYEPSVAASEEFCRNGEVSFLSRNGFPFLMFLKEGNIYVGGNGLHALNWSVPSCEVGYWCRTPYQRMGLTTEAVIAVNEFAFRYVGARRVTLLADVENRASRIVAERAGYMLEGIMKNERIDPSGQLRDTCLYAIAR